MVKLFQTLSEVEDKGMIPKDLKKQLASKITFSKGALNNPYKLKDQKTSKMTAITGELILKKNKQPITMLFFYYDWQSVFKRAEF